MIRTIHIFGGARGMGRWFAERVFLQQELSVSICDTDINTNPQIDKRVSVNKVEFDQDGYKNLPEIDTNDAVILSVPIDAFPIVCQKLFPQLPDGCLVFDIASVKVPTLDSMYRCGNNRLSILGLHPLFGPLVASPVGQIVVLCGYDETQAKHIWLDELLQQCGLLTEKTSPEEHDEAMLYVQVLTHFTYMSFAKVLSHSGKSLADLLQFRTPPFTFLTTFAGRVVGSPPQTYANIQRVPEAKKIREAFLEAARQLDADLDNTHSLSNSINAIRDIVSPWKGHEVAECRSISATGINSLENFERMLYNVRKNNSLCALQRLDKNEVYVGIIKSISVDFIILEERSVVRRDHKSQSAKVAVCISDTAKKNYARKGIRFPNFKEFKILKRNFRILSDPEFQQWKRDDLFHINDDVNIYAPLSFTPDFIEIWLPKTVQELYTVKFINAYATRDHPLTITLNVSYSPELTIEDIKSKIETFLKAASVSFT